MPYTSVHCPDRETFDKLMKIYQEAGWVWCNGGEQPTQWSPRGEWNKKQRIDVQIGESSRTISFPDFLTAQGLEETPEGVIRAKSLKAEDLNVGDWVEVTDNYYPLKEGEKFPIVEIYETDVILDIEKAKEKIIGWSSEKFAMERLWYFPISKLRKCSPPEPKKEPFWKSQTWKIEAPSQNVRIESDGTVFTADSADYKLNFPIPPTSLPPSRMSLMDTYRNSLLSADERKLRKAGVKDSYGTLTSDGKALLLEILAEKYKAELVKEAKKIIKARNGKEDEDAE